LDKEFYEKLDWNVESMRTILIRKYQRVFNLKEQSECVEIMSLTPAERKTIASLFYEGGQTVQMLSKLTFMEKANASKIISSLENKGFVERSVDKKDRRYTLVTISKQGRELIDKFNEEGLSRIKKVLEANLTDNEIVEINDCAARIYEIFKKIKID